MVFPHVSKIFKFLSEFNPEAARKEWPVFRLLGVASNFEYFIISFIWKMKRYEFTHQPNKYIFILRNCDLYIHIKLNKSATPVKHDFNSYFILNLKEK